ncbi:MAG: thermonuclease family protein, partial [Candidatus Omnitrophica bacterium]|nr:thermonuclease family protein [Candidatus Omnitrophota bacterium]
GRQTMDVREQRTKNTIYNIRHTIYFLSIALAFALFGCPAQNASAGSKEYYVQNVIDGDTIALADGKHVRLIGINTPEIKRRDGNTWVLDPEPYAVKAQEFSGRMLFNEKIELEFDSEKEDRYGRVLAYVYVHGKMANLEIVRNGYAWVYTFPPNTKYYDRFIEAEREARQAKRGLWRDVKEIEEH